MMNLTNRTRGRMLIFPLFATLALLVAGCDAGSPTVSRPAATATPSLTPTPKVLYQANWKSDASQWSLAPGWSLTPTGIANSGATMTSIIIPYTPTATSYTVEMVIQVNAVVGPSACGNRFGLEGQTPAGAPIYDAVISCMERNFHSFAHLYAATNTRQFATYDFTPGTSSRTYDVIVDGQYVSYVMNGSFLGTVECDLPTSPSRLMLLNSGLKTEIQRITITTP